MANKQAIGSLNHLNGFIEKLNRLLSFFEQLTQKGKWLTNQFERLIKISKQVPQMTERLTQTIISQNSRTSQEAVLFLLE